MVVQADGKVVVGGWYSTFNGVPRNSIVRLNTDGSLDAAFDPGSGANSFVYALALQADGKVTIARNFIEHWEWPQPPRTHHHGRRRLYPVATHHYRRPRDQLRGHRPEVQRHQHHSVHRSTRGQQVPVPLHQRARTAGLQPQYREAFALLYPHQVVHPSAESGPHLQRYRARQFRQWGHVVRLRTELHREDELVPAGARATAA
ncbi:MAG: delta-60 repeat domain-containing protein [Flavobacteriales bacterium]|nr:delta-60 repeat domain-containing protein [Flavobacteriales bacterium]